MNFTFRPLLSEWRVLGIVKLLCFPCGKNHTKLSNENTAQRKECNKKISSFIFIIMLVRARTVLIFFPAECLCERYESTAVHQFSLRNIISVVISVQLIVFVFFFCNDYYCGTYSACLQCTHSVWAIKLCLLRRTNDFPYTHWNTYKLHPNWPKYFVIYVRVFYLFRFCFFFRAAANKQRRQPNEKMVQIVTRRSQFYYYD